MGAGKEQVRERRERGKEGIGKQEGAGSAWDERREGKEKTKPALLSVSGNLRRPQGFRGGISFNPHKVGSHCNT